MREKANAGRTWRNSILILITVILSASLLLGCSSESSTNIPAKEDETQEDVSSLVTELLPVYSVLESEGGTYYGPAIEGVYTGSGEFHHNPGGVYTGEFVNSKREGSGSFVWENGDTFIGTWKNDAMEEGTYTFSDGRTFTGTFHENQFWNGEYTVVSLPAKHSLKSFSATFVSGKVDALSFITAKGTKYDGQINGNANIEYASGNKYFGSVKDGSRDGNGTYYWTKNGKTIAFYEGSWTNGLMDGLGSYHYTENKYPYVRGVFVNGKLDGEAIYYKEAGNTFTTTWKKGVCKKVK